MAMPARFIDQQRRPGDLGEPPEQMTPQELADQLNKMRRAKGQPDHFDRWNVITFVRSAYGLNYHQDQPRQKRYYKGRELAFSGLWSDLNLLGQLHEVLRDND